MQRDDNKPRRRWFQFTTKAIMIVTLVVAAYLAGRLPEQRRAWEAELRARSQAKQAMMAEQNARMMAEVSMERAQIALQHAKLAEARLMAEKKAPSESPE